MTRSILGTLFLLFSFLAVSAEEPIVLKVATVAPDGTAWTDALHRVQQQIREKTQGQVVLQLFTGGSQGDENQVLKKLQNGTIDAAGFTGSGLGMIHKELRILEVPLLFRNYGEYDYVRKGLTNYFFKRMRDKGFILLAWAEGGFAYFMSQKDISSLDKLRASRVWLRQGDDFNKLCLDAIDAKAVPLALSDVILGIQRGTIETIYVSPLALVAFQWHPHVRYRVDLPLCNILAGFVISEKAFSKVPKQHQKTVRLAFWNGTKSLISQVREDNKKAAVKIAEQGIQTIEVPEEIRKEYEQRGEETARSLVGKQYSQELYDAVRKLLARYREQREQP